MNSTMINSLKRALTLGCLVFALTGTSRVASACQSWYQDAWDDGTTVYSSMAVTEQAPGDSIHAYEQLTSPDNRFASEDTYDQYTYQITAFADLPINFIDGTYSAHGEAYESDVFEGSEDQPKQITPFVEINLTQFTGNPMNRANGSATFIANTLASSGCIGPVTVNAGMSYPTNMDIKISIALPDGNGSQQPSTASGTHTTSANDLGHQFTYSLATGSNNQVSAPNNGATVQAYIQSTPSGCTAVTPSGIQVVWPFTVN